MQRPTIHYFLKKYLLQGQTLENGICYYKNKEKNLGLGALSGVNLFENA